jgi:hypothetical protein
MWKNIVERGRPQMTIWCMNTACWIPKATDTHTDCVILIAFPLQQWLHERVSMLRYTYIACLVTHGLFHCGAHSEHGKKGYNTNYRLKFLTTFKVVPAAAFRLLPMTENVANATGILSCANLCHFAPNL